MNPASEVGPLVASRQRDRVEGYIASGLEEGAKTVLGGSRPAQYEAGWYVEPTIFTGVTNDMRIAREEIFGPVLSVIPFRNEAAAVALANDSDYGLAGSVWTGDVEHGLDIARQVRVGSYGVNTYGLRRPSPLRRFQGERSGPRGWSRGPSRVLRVPVDSASELVRQDRDRAVHEGSRSCLHRGQRALEGRDDRRR